MNHAGRIDFATKNGLMVCLRDDIEGGELYVTFCKTMLCLNVYRPCCGDTLQGPKIYAVVHTSLLQREHLLSVVICHLLRLEGDGSVSYVEPRQKKVRLFGISIRETEEKYC